jgi:hypothetical protein
LINALPLRVVSSSYLALESPKRFKTRFRIPIREGLSDSLRGIGKSAALSGEKSMEQGANQRLSLLFLSHYQIEAAFLGSLSLPNRLISLD